MHTLLEKTLLPNNDETKTKSLHEPTNKASQKKKTLCDVKHQKSTRGGEKR